MKLRESREKRKPDYLNAPAQNSPPKKSKSAVKASGRRSKKATRKTPTRKVKPNSLVCPETGDKVWVTTATLQDIKTAERTGKQPFPTNRKYLVTLSSPTVRQEIYDRCAYALEDIETGLLPEYGSRPWKVVVKITDPKQSPYFCFNGPNLELAVWPHLIDRIPHPPRFPGYSQSRTANNPQDEEDEEEPDEEWQEIYDLQEREMNPLCRLALQERWRVPIPNISVKWISPLRQIFYTRKTAWENAVQLCKQEVLLDKVLHGYGANGKPLPITQPSKRTALKAGKIRFERDGLWVVGQEEVWQIERLEQMEEAKIDDETTTSNCKPKPRMSPLAYYIQCNRKKHQKRRICELQKAAEQSMATGSENAALKETVKETQGVEPVQAEVATSLEMASAAKNDQHSSEAVENPKVSSDNIASADLAEKDHRVVTKQTGPSTPQLKVESNASGTSPSAKSVSFTLRDAERELRALWKALSDEERQDWTEKAQKYEQSLDGDQHAPPKPESDQIESNTIADKSSSNEPLVGRVTPPTEVKASVENSSAASSVKVTSTSEAEANNDEHGMARSGEIVTASPSPVNVNLDPLKFSNMDTAQPSDTGRKVSASSHKPNDKEKPTMPEPAKKNSDRKQNPDTGKLISSAKNQSSNMFVPSSHWRLNAEQIKLCYDAGLDHYDQIMRTVQARDLSRELQDGFDLLRERGRGRFDMELPAFVSPRFSFLTDLKKAPWMPVVREILGKDVVLIHKGMFLSMPGAETQEYHQDGPHLTTQFQKPCHAINVFIPVVDLTDKNGPTEFCLASHILGQEEYDKDFVEVPKASAGTPVIFDYRLGHKGLGNSSASCRPIVYCTYAAAADGKEFRDSVNFSRKRYHRIGDLVSKAPSREERAKKRERSIEDQQLYEALAASALPIDDGNLDGATPDSKKVRVEDACH